MPFTKLYYIAFILLIVDAIFKESNSDHNFKEIFMLLRYNSNIKFDCHYLKTHYSINLLVDLLIISFIIKNFSISFQFMNPS